MPSSDFYFDSESYAKKLSQSLGLDCKYQSVSDDCYSFSIKLPCAYRQDDETQIFKYQDNRYLNFEEFLPFSNDVSKNLGYDNVIMLTANVHVLNKTNFKDLRYNFGQTLYNHFIKPIYDTETGQIERLLFSMDEQKLLEDKMFFDRLFLKAIQKPTVQRQENKAYFSGAWSLRLSGDFNHFNVKQDIINETQIMSNHNIPLEWEDYISISPKVDNDNEPETRLSIYSNILCMDDDVKTMLKQNFQNALHIVLDKYQGLSRTAISIKHNHFKTELGFDWSDMSIVNVGQDYDDIKIRVHFQNTDANFVKLVEKVFKQTRQEICGIDDDNIQQLIPETQSFTEPSSFTFPLKWFKDPMLCQNKKQNFKTVVETTRERIDNILKKHNLELKRVKEKGVNISYKKTKYDMLRLMEVRPDTSKILNTIITRL